MVIFSTKKELISLSIVPSINHYNPILRLKDIECIPQFLLVKYFQSCFDNLNSLWQPPGKDTIEYFTLRDLWDCYDEWSAYGAGTPVLLNGGETVMQYYVPYISALQIYTNKSAVTSRYGNYFILCFVDQIHFPSFFFFLLVMILGNEIEQAIFSSCRNRKEDSDVVEFENDSWSDDSGSDNLSTALSNNSSKAWDAVSEDSSLDQEGSSPMRDRLGCLYLQYIEMASPYWRVPLMDKVLLFTCFTHIFSILLISISILLSSNSEIWFSSSFLLWLTFSFR